VLLVSGCPPVRLSAQIPPTATRLWQPDDRTVISDLTVVTAVAATRNLVYAATASGLAVYDRAFRTWKETIGPIDGLPLARVVTYTFLLIFLIIALMPAYVLIVTSLKSGREIGVNGQWNLPKEWTFGNSPAKTDADISTAANSVRTLFIVCILRSDSGFPRRPSVAICSANV